MKKIISLFQRNYDGDHLVRNEVVPGAEWVINGEGFATRKWDGTSCMVKDGGLFKRYDSKNGKVPPTGFIPAQRPDEITGHWPGWLPITFQDKWHYEALKLPYILADGTYELCGPKINGNPEKFAEHVLLPHGKHPYWDCPRKFEAIKEWFAEHEIEGVVWHHDDGRMVKIKKNDFGLERQC